MVEEAPSFTEQQGQVKMTKSDTKLYPRFLEPGGQGLQGPRPGGQFNSSLIQQLLIKGLGPLLEELPVTPTQDPTLLLLTLPFRAHLSFHLYQEPTRIYLQEPAAFTEG